MARGGRQKRGTAPSIAAKYHRGERLMSDVSPFVSPLSRQSRGVKTLPVRVAGAHGADNGGLPAQARELSQTVHRFDARAMGAHHVPDAELLQFRRRPR